MMSVFSEAAPKSVKADYAFRIFGKFLVLMVKYFLSILLNYTFVEFFNKSVF